MIYTVTFNPSIDYYVSLGELRRGALNRAESETLMPGGKGINVSMMLRNLGTESIALGFIGGFTGAEVVRKLDEIGICSDFVNVDGAVSRINVKVSETGSGAEEGSRDPDSPTAFSDDGSESGGMAEQEPRDVDRPGPGGMETEINGRGPVVDRKALSEFYLRLDKLHEDDVLVLSGAVPAGMKDTAYADIMQYLGDRGIQVIVDASGPLIRHTLASRPFLIKPNRAELEELFGVRIKSDDEVVSYAAKLQTAGARNVLISLDKEGAVLLTEDGKSYRQPAPSGKAINTIGAGDSLIAGFISEYFCGSEDYAAALHMGVAAGSATAFTQGFADRRAVSDLAQSMEKPGRNTDGTIQ